MIISVESKANHDKVRDHSNAKVSNQRLFKFWIDSNVCKLCFGSHGKHFGKAPSVQIWQSSDIYGIGGSSDICGKSCDHIIPPAETTSIFKIQPAFKMSFHTFKKLQKARQFSFQGPKLIHVLKTGSFSFVFIKALLDWLNLKVETASAIKSYLKWMSDDPSIAFQNDHRMSPLL